MTNQQLIIGFGCDRDMIQALAVEVACAQKTVEVGSYADNERFIKLGELSAELDVIVYADMRPGKGNIEDLFLLCAALSNKVKSVVAFLPYFPYVRNKKMAESIVGALEATGVAEVVSLDLHQTIPSVHNLEAADSYRDVLPEGTVISPDSGGAERAMALARKLRTSVMVASKHRGPQTTVTLDISREKEVIVYDDIYATGATINACLQSLEQQKVETVYVCVTHITGKDTPQFMGDLDVRWIESPAYSPKALAKLLTSWQDSSDARRTTSSQMP